MLGFKYWIVAGNPNLYAVSERYYLEQVEEINYIKKEETVI